MKHIMWSSGHNLKFNNIVDSDNSFLFDSDGKKLIDLESGVWCTSVGHNNKRINKVITSQINRITHTGFCYCNPQIEETAKKVLEIAGIKNGKCEFLSSGSEAIEYGMQVARLIADKPLALTFSDSYFGAFGDALIKETNKWHIYNWLECTCGNGGNGCIGECDSFNSIPFDKIGIFLFEPGSSSGLVRFPSKTLITKICNILNAQSGIVMANEITTGIGRTGLWFGYQHYSIIPDIVAIGKGVGNGYPVSIAAFSKIVTKKLESKKFKYSQSHQNDPLGAYIANEVINIISEEKLLEYCFEVGDFLMNELNRIDPEKRFIKEIRGRGLMIAVEFTQHSQMIYEELLERGFIVAKRSNVEVLRIDPALTIEKETLCLFIDVMSEIIKMSS